MECVYTGEILTIGEIESVSNKLDKQIITVGNSFEFQAFQLLNATIYKYNGKLKKGDKVTVRFTIKSSQWNGRYFVNLNIDSIEAVKPEPPPQEPPTNDPPPKDKSKDKCQQGPKNTRSRKIDWFAGCFTTDEFKKRYRELCLEHHPDKGGNEETMKEINLIYQINKKAA